MIQLLDMVGNYMLYEFVRIIYRRDSCIEKGIKVANSIPTGDDPKAEELSEVDSGRPISRQSLQSGDLGLECFSLLAIGGGYSYGARTCCG